MTGRGLASQLVQVSASIGGGLLALAAMARALRVSEFAETVTTIELRVRKLLGI